MVRERREGIRARACKQRASSRLSSFITFVPLTTPFPPNASRTSDSLQNFMLESMRILSDTIIADENRSISCNALQRILPGESQANRARGFGRAFVMERSKTKRGHMASSRLLRSRFISKIPIDMGWKERQSVWYNNNQPS